MRIDVRQHLKDVILVLIQLRSEGRLLSSERNPIILVNL